MFRCSVESLIHGLLLTTYKISFASYVYIVFNITVTGNRNTFRMEKEDSQQNVKDGKKGYLKTTLRDKVIAMEGIARKV